MIGKPYAGELHVRFDEGEQDFVSRKILNGHEAGNGGYSQGSTYQTLSLFSTLPLCENPVPSLHDSTTPSHQPFPLLHRIVRALGSKTKSATMQSVPTMLIAAAAQGAPIAADKAPMSVPPRSNNT
jgi:hypothetical protein